MEYGDKCIVGKIIYVDNDVATSYIPYDKTTIGIKLNDLKKVINYQEYLNDLKNNLNENNKLFIEKIIVIFIIILVIVLATINN